MRRDRCLEHCDCRIETGWAREIQLGLNTIVEWKVLDSKPGCKRGGSPSSTD